MGEIIEFRGPKRHPANDETVFLHPVRGDSMEPTARHGDVWIYEAADRFTGPGIYAIMDGSSYSQFKRLEPVPGSGLPECSLLATSRSTGVRKSISTGSGSSARSSGPLPGVDGGAAF